MDMSPPPKYSGDDYTADELPPKMSTRGTRRGPMSTQKKIAYSQGMEEEDYTQKPMNKLRTTGPPKPNLSFIHCFGDADNFLSYSIED